MLRSFFMAYRDTVLADSPIEYWELNEASGTSGASTGSGAHALAITGATVAAGKIGNARLFNGVDNIATASSVADFMAGTTYSVEAWFKWDDTSKDYPTIVRRDGNSKSFILRGRKGTLADRPGAIEVYVSGKTVDTGATKFNDNAWHHVVATYSSGTIRLFIDKVEYVGTNGTSTAGGTGTTALYVGSNTGSTVEQFKGIIDEVAIYNTALTPTRIAAHYDASTANVSYTDLPMTSTATFVNPVITAVKNVNVAGGVATANASMTDAGVQNRTDKYSPSRENAVSSASPTTATDATAASQHIVAGKEVYLAFDGFSLPADATGISATLDLELFNAIYTSPSVFKIGTIDGAWDSTVTWNTKPATGAIQTPTQSFSTIGTKTFDVSALIPNLRNRTATGLAIMGVSGDSLVNTQTNKPALTVSYWSSGAMNVVVVPLTGSGLMPDTVFNNATPVQISASVFSGSALALDPVVSLVKHLNVGAPVFTASAEGPLGGFAMPVTVVGDAATASGEAVNASVTAELNAVVHATASNSQGVLMAPLEAQNATDDPYYNRVYATSDSGDYWYRLDEVAGAVVNEVRDPNKIADLFGYYSFGVYGPEGRRSMHFTNGYFQPRAGATTDMSGGIDSETATMTFETVIRTTNGNGVLAYGLDNKPQQAVFRNAIYLKDGKVSIDWNRLDGATPFTLTGFKNVADGDWHHIVVTVGNGNAKDLDNGLRVYIDGKLDVRRRMEVLPDLWATPDSYFGMPDSWRNVTPLFPWQGNFDGDVMEVIFRTDNNIIADTAQTLYYNVFGIVPINAGVATSYAYAPNAVAKGNRKRALVLYVKWNGAGNYNDPRAGYERNAPSGLDSIIPDEFDHAIEIGRVFEPGEAPYLMLQDYRVVAMPIMQEDALGNTGPYRDVITDLPRLINLQQDIDPESYDLIVFRNWPDEGADQEVFKSRGYSNDAVDNFLTSVHEAVVNGKSLEVTNPNLASRLGLISGAEAVPMSYDRKSGGETDLRAAMINPWDTDKVGNTYLDLHANNWHRVTANVHNLTDLNGEHITEAYMNYNFGTNGDVPTKWGYKLSDQPLRIGTELLDPISFWLRKTSFEKSVDVSTLTWDKRVWAIKPDGLVTGTPLYKFASTMYAGNTPVANPYSEYIGAAVVEPGDTWGGQRIAGKVFINLAESPFYAVNGFGLMARQIVPPNSEINEPIKQEDDAKREWDYSYNRVGTISVNLSSVDQSKSAITVVANPDGTISFKQSSNGTTVGVNEYESYPTENVIVPTWAQRGLAWLSATTSIGSGDVIIRPTGATATGSMLEPQTKAQKSVEVSAQSSAAIGVLVSPAEAHDPDVTVIALPAQADGYMTGYGKTITVAPFEASGELVDNFDLISAAGEQVVVYLHYADAEVYLKEENK